jgi:acyl CoA:acetate/3-ketoacid CoA transferase beta subunit
MSGPRRPIRSRAQLSQPSKNPPKRGEEHPPYAASAAVRSVSGRFFMSRNSRAICVLDVTSAGFELIEVAPGMTPEHVQEMIEPKLIVAGEVREISM